MEVEEDTGMSLLYLLARKVIWVMCIITNFHLSHHHKQRKWKLTSQNNKPLKAEKDVCGFHPSVYFVEEEEKNFIRQKYYE